MPGRPGPNELIRLLRVIAGPNVGEPAPSVTVLSNGFDERRTVAYLLSGSDGDDEGDCVRAYEDVLGQDPCSGREQAVMPCPVGADGDHP